MVVEAEMTGPVAVSSPPIVGVLREIVGRALLRAAGPISTAITWLVLAFVVVLVGSVLVALLTIAIWTLSVIVPEWLMGTSHLYGLK